MLSKSVVFSVLVPLAVGHAAPAQISVTVSSGQVCSTARCNFLGSCSLAECKSAVPAGNAVNTSCFEFPDWVISRSSAEVLAGGAPGVATHAFGESDGCPGTADASLVTGFAAVSPTAVELLVHASVERVAPITTSIARGLAEVDLGDDGSVDYSTVGAAVDAAIPAVLTSRPLAVRTRAEALASGPYQVMSNFFPDRTDVDVSVRAGAPAQGVLTTDLSPCGGLELGALLEPGAPGQLALWADDPSVPAVGFFTFGGTALSVPIPPQGCIVGSELLIALPAVLGPGGASELDVPLPQPIPAVTFYVQYLSATVTSGVATSNRIRVVF